MTDPTTTTLAPVVHELDIGAPIATCFRTFVDGIGSWWPPEHHIGELAIAEMRVEPTVGGRLYDVDVEGGECHWGTVLAIEPPARFVFAWHVQVDWTIDTDPAKQSEVEVSFSELNPDRTHVRLEHRHIERHGDGAEGMRAAVAGPGGWPGSLARFMDAAEGREPRAMTS
jgi:uncharacterized protein YndB with AHSA1/START domain